MSEENLVETVRRSKRNRTASFDISRISVQTLPKYRKKDKNGGMVNPPGIDPAIIDMSQTINANSIPNNNLYNAVSNGNASGSQNSMPIGNEMNNVLKEMVDTGVNNAQLSLRPLVKECIGEEMRKVYEAIGKLGDIVKNLNVGNNAQNNQQNNSPFPFPYPPPTIETNRRSEIPTNNMMSNPPGPNLDRPSKVEKFKLKFDGNQSGMSVEDFVFRLEYLKNQYRVSWEEIYAEFQSLLTGSAYEWYWLQIKTGVVKDWHSLKDALYRRYSTTRSNFEVMSEIVDRKLKPGEDIDTFFQSINTLRAKLVQPISDGELIQIVKRNLKGEIFRMVYPMNVGSMEQLRMECILAEKTCSKRDVRYMPPPPNRQVRVNEVTTENYDYDCDYYGDDQIQEVSEMKTDPICWNCRKTGHRFMDCLSTQRTLFCYRCGQPDTVAPRCPKCKSENAKKSMISAGRSCSGDKPVTSNQLTM
ncbi:uncharacterized protein [Musca autumnalis]|uniref:uncharacterized protein n=1 Tax=Musca autumnalis TaxID=221902 RepID=UPI003CEB9891